MVGLMGRVRISKSDPDPPTLGWGEEEREEAAAVKSPIVEQHFSWLCFFSGLMMIPTILLFFRDFF